MIDHLVDNTLPHEEQLQRWQKICTALIAYAERPKNRENDDFVQFERSILLENEVRTRTKELETTLALLNQANARLAWANRETEVARADLANAIETVQEGFALFNAQDRLVLSNSRFCQYLPDLKSRLQPDLEFSDFIEAQSQSPFLALRNDARRNQWKVERLKAHRNHHEIYKLPLIWNRWMQVSEHRTRDGGTVILQTDITDVMRLEQRERERLIDDQTRLIKATLEHLNQGVCIFDNVHRLAGWNSRIRELLPLSVKSLRLGASFFSFERQLHDKIELRGAITFQEIANWVALGPARAPLRFEIEREPDTILDAYAQTMPDGGFVISFSDVSQERNMVNALAQSKASLEQRVAARTAELEEALVSAERANASKTRFVAAASHDLLQPLSAAKLYLDMISDLDRKSAEALAGKARRALDSVDNLIQALLDISKLDSGRAALHISEIDLSSIFSSIRDEVYPIAAKKNVEIAFRPTCAMILSDAIYLRRIMQNLIGNAIRYTDRGKILVAAQRRGASYRISVFDTGPGIPEDQQKSIFKEFHRLEPTVSASEGLGLGLAIVERACKLLDHPLALRSKLGRGSWFSFSVPAALTGQRKKRLSQAADKPIALIISDMNTQIYALEKSLLNCEIDVLHSRSIPEALRLVGEIDLDIDYVFFGQTREVVSDPQEAMRIMSYMPSAQCICLSNSDLVTQRLDLTTLNWPTIENDLHDILQSKML